MKVYKEYCRHHYQLSWSRKRKDDNEDSLQKPHLERETESG